MINRLVALLLCFCILTGCSAGLSPDRHDDEPTEEQVYALLFDIHNTVMLKLDMEETEIAKMQRDYEQYSQQGSKSPIYRKGDLTVQIQTPEGKSYSFTIPEVGVRMKGNTSRTDFYSKDEGIYNIIHLKLSFQETFDDEAYYGSDSKKWSDADRKLRKNRTFATLEKLDLRWNRCDDGTYLKEYFAYETYRQYGVPAPRTNLCSFDWADMHMGVFTINEPVDKIFLEKHLPASAQGGDLYKVGWAGSNNGSFTNTYSIGIEDEDAGKFYAYDLKTNKKTSNHEALIGFIRNTNSKVTKETFADLVDLDSFLPFCAVSYLLGNPDDMRNNYNNFYIYFRPDNGKAVFIPYDYDRCLGITAHWNPTGNGVTGDDPFSVYRNADGSAQLNPVVLYSVASGGYYVEEYAALLRTILEGSWFTDKNFSSLYAIAAENYGSLTRPSQAFYNTDGLYLSFDLHRTSPFDSKGNISFAQYLQTKTATAEKYLNDMDKYAYGQPAITQRWYIRSDKTNWQTDEAYAMEEADGVMLFHLTVSGQMRLKVYDNVSDRWYGAECVAEDTQVAFTSDGHTNIVLEEGRYVIVFDPVTAVITLEKEA